MAVAAHVLPSRSDTQLAPPPPRIRGVESDLERAWNDVHEATPRGWIVCPPSNDTYKTVPWSMYAYDPHEKPKVGHRSREWTAVRLTELDVVREMARCLRVIGEGGVPR